MARLLTSLNSVDDRMAIDLTLNNRAGWVYTLDGFKKFRPGTTAQLKVYNAAGTVIDTWPATVSANLRSITIDQDADDADAIPAGTWWRLYVNEPGDYYVITQRRVVAQGQFTRSDPQYPNFSEIALDAADYQYSFVTPGYLTDPSWRIIKGEPRIYDNSERNLPNGVAAGSRYGGDPVKYGTAAIMWYAPLNTDTVSLSYRTIRNFDNSNGELWVVISSNYDMTAWAGFYHRQQFAYVGAWDQDELEIVTGTGPLTFTTRQTTRGDTANNSYYTAQYNFSTNTYKLFQGAQQLLTWTDTNNIVKHGPGRRYVGFGFKGAKLNAGVQIADWNISG